MTWQAKALLRTLSRCGGRIPSMQQQKEFLPLNGGLVRVSGIRINGGDFPGFYEGTARRENLP